MGKAVELNKGEINNPAGHLVLWINSKLKSKNPKREHYHMCAPFFTFYFLGRICEEFLISHF